MHSTAWEYSTDSFDWNLEGFSLVAPDGTERPAAEELVRVYPAAIAGTGEMVERTCADHLLIHARHAGGCVSSIEIVSGDSTPLRFELQGTEGKLEITGGHPGGYQCGALTVTGPPGSAQQPVSDLSSLEGAAINVAELWRRFEQDIRTGSRTCADFAMAVKLHRLLDAIELSSDEGRNVTLDDSA